MRVFRILFGTVSLTLLAILTIPCFIALFMAVVLIPGRGGVRAAHKVARVWSLVCLACTCVRLKVKGREKIDPNKTYVFVANHQSQLDIPVYARACRNTFRFLAKAELKKIPVIGYAVTRVYVTVDRSDKNDRSRSLQAMKSSLDENVSVFLCPEGTRNRDMNKQKLLPFKDGAFRLAIETQTPMAVLTVVDSGKRNSPKSQLELIPGTIHCVWNEPIETKGMTLDDLDGLKNKVYEIMMKNLESNK
ncbi:MAG TPA: lysophospholipid acyltransferase family protein [Bacteroidia bacterium]|jgi:1-acyl-sn-glycerol-3-phosphate acyltransferase